MAVDDVGAFDRKSEFLEDFITEFLFFAQLKQKPKLLLTMHKL